MTLQEWEQEKDRELEASMTALFKAVGPPGPPSGFASRTMKAVRRAPLPAGRRALGHPWQTVATPIGWAALVAAAAAAAFGFVVNQRLAAEAFTSLVAIGIRGGMRLLQFVHTGSDIFDLFVTTGGVVARVMSTREATAGLTLMTGVAALSLLMLHRLLVSNKESSSW